MASPVSMRLSRAAALRCSRLSTTIHRPLASSSPVALQVQRLYSSSEPAPPFLQQLKGDLKTAMRAKDAPRLTVLRAILAENLNASKTASPIRTDAQLVALIRRLQKASTDAASDAAAAGRQDLVEKEQEQAGILEEYASRSGVTSVQGEELKRLVEETVGKVREDGVAAKQVLGEVMKRLKGAMEGRDVDTKEMARIAKELAGQ